MLMKYRRGVYVGKFQPFHKGHLKCIQYALSKVDELIILVGSAQLSHTFNNPFTAGERIEMIRRALKDENIKSDRYLIIPVEDTFGIHSIWVSKVTSILPKFEVVFTNEPLTRRLFLEAGFKVESIPLYRRKLYSATEVRRRIIEGEDWASLVPSAVHSYIISIGGDERLRDLLRSDKEN